MPIEIIKGATLEEVKETYNRWERRVVMVMSSRAVVLPNGQLGCMPLQCGNYQLSNISEDYSIYDEGKIVRGGDYDFKPTIALMFFHNYDFTKYTDQVSIKK